MHPSIWILAFLALAPEAGAQRKVILFIGDGVGASYWTAARFASENLSVQQFKTMGLVDTRSASNAITESAAGASAYATGVRTFNGAISVGTDSQPRETVLEAAKKMGWATGIVATSSVTDATPAAFVAHVPSRMQQFEIARQMAVLAPDVIMGGGARFFASTTRPDRDDLLTRLDATHTIVTEPAVFANLDTNTTKLVGLFGAQDMPPASVRSPTLPAMTKRAIDILSKDPDGFFLMVEGSQPDWRGHDNQPIGAVVAEMLDFDAAIGVALAYQRRVPDVLILVVADHETGGLAIGTARDSAVLTQTANSLTEAVKNMARAIGLLDRSSADSMEKTATQMQVTSARMQATARNARGERLVADYTTGGHTAQMVPLFASGPGAEAFAGMIDNNRVGQLLLEIVRRPPTPVRRRR